MSFLDSILPQKGKTRYFLTLEIGHKTIKAAVWEESGEIIKIIGRGNTSYEKSSEQIEAADEAILKAEEGLPEDVEVTQVIFGLPLDYVENDKIKKTELARLKKLVSNLSLSPLGFIEIPQALAHYFQKKEGSPATSVLVEVGLEQLSVSLLRVGKIYENTVVPRTNSPAFDLEKALKSFTSIDVLPSKIVLYDEGQDLEDIREEFIKYPWQQKAAFLHFPKIEVLDKEITLNALVDAATGELAKKVTLDTTGTAEETPETPSEKAATAETKQIDEKALSEESKIENVSVKEEPNAELLGFVKEKDINITEPEEDIFASTITPNKKVTTMHAYVKKEAVAKPEFKSLKPKMKLPQFHLRLPNFSFSSLNGLLPILIGAVLLLLLGGGGIFYAAQTLPRANLSLIVDPKTMDQELEITISPSTNSVDKDKKTIPGKTLEVGETDQAGLKTTGKKNVGDPASGDITVYNKTTNSKTFTKGVTIISSDNLKFTLNDDVTIASASDTGEGLNYGKTSVKVTAVNIGPEGNLPANTTFTLADFPNSLYSAKNSGAFSHGTSREISAISKSDQDKLLATLSSTLTQKAKDDFYQKLVSGEKLLEKSIKGTVSTKKYSKDVGDEGSDLNLELAMNFRGVIYREADLNELIKQIALGQTPAGFDFSPEKTSISTDEPIINKDGSITFKAEVKIYLLPKIDVEKISRDVTGKSFSDTENYIRQIDNVAGISIYLNTPLPFGKTTMPANPQNIKINIVAR